MVAKVENKIEMKKEWIAPELKKVSIEEITAHYLFGRHNDGGGNQFFHRS